MIISQLNEIDEIKEPEKIAGIIESAIQIIKTYPISKKVKQNRINFLLHNAKNAKIKMI